MSKNIISGQYNGHDFVEIGGIKWSTCNVGADKSTDAGLYFQWGDRKGYTADEVGKVKRFNSQHYKHHNNKRYTKYNEFDSKQVLDLCDDAAFAYMGHGWRMPTTEEYAALGNAVNMAWTKNYHRSGVAGIVLTDITDKSKELFFPAVGICCDGGVYGVDSYGGYWSDSLSSGDAPYGRSLFFSSDVVHWQSSYFRSNGFPVRGILSI